jgi:acetyl esterase/lipase
VTESSTPTWEARFRAPYLYLPDWSPRAPDRLVYASNETGVWQVHTWDHATGRRRLVTEHPVGLMDGVPTLDGEGVLWFQDETGDESGRWFVQPFEGGESRPFLDGLPHGWNEGLAQAPGIVVAVISNRDGFGVYTSVDGKPAERVAHSSESLMLGESLWSLRGFSRVGLSADGSMLCLEHSEHGDLIHPALRVIDPRTGGVIADLHDPGLSLHAACWSPVEGDGRLAVVHERSGDERPAIWNPRTGELTELSLDLGGGVEAQDWWPDGSALLLAHLEKGRHRLLRYELATGTTTPIVNGGLIHKARVRPDGRVWFLQSQGDRQPRAMDDRGQEVLAPEGDRPPPSRPYTSWDFQNEHGQSVHGFYVLPEAEPGPWPVMLFVHGGPTALDMDRWQPEVQAYVDAGFAVGLLNYRGSTGYGREWRDTLTGNVGGPELEDVNAGLADLVRLGFADPARAVIAGWSWGGYVTLLELGKQPELWACGVAGVPVADYVESYVDASPLLQAYDRALLGGVPAELPELMADRNPINFADGVRAPLLILAGEHDSRCPIRQVLLYVDKLKELGKPPELYLFSTGHGSFDVEERIRQIRIILDFLERSVPPARIAAR